MTTYLVDDHFIGSRSLVHALLQIIRHMMTYENHRNSHGVPNFGCKVPGSVRKSEIFDKLTLLEMNRNCRSPPKKNHILDSLRWDHILDGIKWNWLLGRLDPENQDQISSTEVGIITSTGPCYMCWTHQFNIYRLQFVVDVLKHVSQRQIDYT